MFKYGISIAAFAVVSMLTCNATNNNKPQEENSIGSIIYNKTIRPCINYIKRSPFSENKTDTQNKNLTPQDQKEKEMKHENVPSVQEEEITENTPINDQVIAQTEDNISEHEVSKEEEEIYDADGAFLDRQLSRAQSFIVQAARYSNESTKKSNTLDALEEILEYNNKKSPAFYECVLLFKEYLGSYFENEKSKWNAPYKDIDLQGFLDKK